MKLDEILMQAPKNNLKEEVEELKKVLGVKSYREVGEKTFEYYKDAEC